MVSDPRIARGSQTWLRNGFNRLAWQAGLLAHDSRHTSSRSQWTSDFLVCRSDEKEFVRTGHLQRRVRGGFSPPSLTPAPVNKSPSARDVKPAAHAEVPRNVHRAAGNPSENRRQKNDGK